MADSVMMVAAEASSSLYAQRLLELWRTEGRKVAAFGIGSRQMEQLGFECVGRSEELAVVGLQEVLAHWSQIKSCFYKLLDEADRRKPKYVLLMDYPDFNLRLAKQLKKRGHRVVYYISPQIWAWRKSRVFFIKKWVDLMLVLFPFEKDFYDSHAVANEFVGHPLLDELSDELTDKKEILRARARYGFSPNDIVLGLMPGSRHSELKHHLQIQLKVAERLQKNSPKLKVALFVAPHFEVEQIKQMLPQGSQLYLTVIKDEPFKMICLSDVVLTASGTATLMVGLLAKPMVIMYKMSPLSGWLAKLIVKGTDFFGLVNLILKKKVAPELFQQAASEEGLIQELKPLIELASARENMAAELQQLNFVLGEKGVTQRVSEALRRFEG